MCPLPHTGKGLGELNDHFNFDTGISLTDVRMLWSLPQHLSETQEGPMRQKWAVIIV